jgi:signal transduction histidine kinase/CheY-like chemotaxis protein
LLQIKAPLKQPALLGTNLQILTSDVKAQYTADEAAALLNNEVGTTRLSNHDGEIGRIQYPVWARVAIENQTPTSSALVITHGQPTIESHQAYLLRPGVAGWQRLYGHHETAKIAFERHREPSYDIEIKPGEKVELLFRWATFAPIKAPIMVYSADAFKVYSRWQVLFYTVAATLPIFCLIGLVVIRRISTVNIDIMFIGFVLSDMLGTAWITGMLSVFLPTFDAVVLRQVGHAAFATMSLLSVLHATRFLELDSLCPRWALCLRAWAVVGALVTIVSIFISLYASSQITLIFGFSTALFVTGTCLYAYKNHIPFSRSYSIAWSIYSLTVLVYLLYRFNLVPLQALGLAFIFQNAGVCLVLSGTVVSSMYSRDSRLKDALTLADQRRRQLEIVNVERDRLFAVVSHDLRQPLQAIGLNLGLLQANGSKEVAISERIRLAVVSMNDILSSLLDLRRATSETNGHVLAPLELQPLLDRLCQDYREQARMKQISFKNVATSTWAVTDAVWLERVLRNLITNAMRYTDSGRVLLGVRRLGSNRLKISVIDTGRGLSEAQLERINSSTIAPPNPELRDSYGLGLYIVKRLCQQMNAQLMVRSEFNAGSVFDVILARHHPNEASIIESTHKGKSSVANAHILLVDDDQMLLQIMALHLRQEGAHVTTLSNPDDALKALRARRFELIVTDYNLGPGVTTGLDLLGLSPNEVKKCLISGDLEKLRQTGFQVLAKPFTMEHLSKTLGQLLKTS